MEKVDVYNAQHEKLNYTKEKYELKQGEYRLSCFVFIINDEDKILIQQRLATAKKCPNMWEVVSGGAIEGDTAVSGALREMEEELGIKARKEDLKFIGSYVRINDYVEVFLLEKNIDINNLKLQDDEVGNAKWVNINEFEELIKQEKASDTGFYIFKNYYDNFYKKYIVFVNGKPVLKNIMN